MWEGIEMKMRHGVGLGMLFAAAVVLVLLAPAQAGGGRSGAAATVTDATQLAAEILPSSQITFRATFTDAENDTAAPALILLDGSPVSMVAEDAADTNTTDGKIYNYTTSLGGGSHSYSFAFSDGSNWTNTTAKSFSVNWAPSTGDWVISGAQTVANANIELKGNLTVPSGASLELRNTTVKFNGATDGQYRLEVQGGGSLKLLENSVITKATGAKAYLIKVKPGATFNMKGSEIWFCGWENLQNNSDMGIFVEGNTLIENSLIVAGGQGIGAKGIIAENTNLVMRNTTVKEAYRRNVEATNAVITMEDCTVDHSTDACNVEFFTGTKATIVRCTIKKNGHNGIWMKDGAQATVTDCLITESNQNGIWMDNSCTLTISNTIIEKSQQNGMWINGSSTVTATNVTIRNNAMNGTWISGGRITITMSRIETHELHGFAGFDGCQVVFTKNFVNNSKRHNYETTNCTTDMQDCVFMPSRDACNVEFFIRSKATVKNVTINGAGHNCFWLSDNVEVTIEGGDFSSSPNNVIWANLSSKVTVKNCILRNAQKDGIWAADSTITVEGCTIKDNGLGGGAEGWGIEVENCTLTVTSTTFANNPKGQIWVKNYLDVKALDDKGKALSGATVKITDQAKNVTFNGKSDATGGIGGPKLLTSYIQDNAGKKTDYTYTVSVTKGDLEGTKKVTLTGAQTVELKTKAKAKPQPGFEALVLLTALIGVAVLAAGRKRK